LLLGELVANLIDNAVRYVPAQGFVNVSLQNTSDGPELTVSDSGAGVPAEQLDNLGVPFYRAPGITTSEGCGLGLAIVREIARLHRALLSFRCDTDKTGFHVGVQFPLQSINEVFPRTILPSAT
jgi:two-component system sensor histidine kinase TctE